MIDLQSPAALSRIGPGEVPREGVFRALDGHDFRIDGNAVHVEVYGVFDEGGHRWVQLALGTQHPRLLTLRLDEATRSTCEVVSASPAAHRQRRETRRL